MSDTFVVKYKWKLCENHLYINFKYLFIETNFQPLEEQEFPDQITEVLSHEVR